MKPLNQMTKLYLDMRNNSEMPITAAYEILDLLKLELFGVLKVEDVADEVGEPAVAFELVEGSYAGVDAERKELLEYYLSKSEFDMILRFVKMKQESAKEMAEAEPEVYETDIKDVLKIRPRDKRRKRLQSLLTEENMNFLTDTAKLKGVSRNELLNSL